MPAFAGLKEEIVSKPVIVKMGSVEVKFVSFSPFYDSLMHIMQNNFHNGPAKGRKYFATTKSGMGSGVLALPCHPRLDLGLNCLFPTLHQ